MSEKRGEKIMSARCHQEIIDLHRFFVDWFAGQLPRTDAAFARLNDVLAEGMVLISPAGAIQRRDQILSWIGGAYGTRKEATPPFRIWIEQFQLHHQVGRLALVTYEEWQEIEGETTARLSSALFREKEGTPHGVEWLHVHETWLAR